MKVHQVKFSPVCDWKCTDSKSREKFLDTRKDRDIIGRFKQNKKIPQLVLLAVKPLKYNSQISKIGFFCLESLYLKSTPPKVFVCGC